MKLNPTQHDFTGVVEQHYQPLYRFALSLSRCPSDASDLTQQAFYLAQTRGHQLRDGSKVRAWLSTTLRRLFLARCRHETRFPKHELSTVEHELPRWNHDHFSGLDAAAVREALHALADHFRRPLVMFYLEDRSYRQIASTLRIPMGTVMSRLSRGKRLLRARLESFSDHANN